MWFAVLMGGSSSAVAPLTNQWLLFAYVKTIPSEQPAWKLKLCGPINRAERSGYRQ